MFHSYVRAASGKMVDIGRAQFLMDKELARQAAEWVDANRDLLTARFQEGLEEIARQCAMAGHPIADPYVPRLPTKDHWDQVFWDYYSERHREKYGEPFTPDIDQEWD